MKILVANLGSTSFKYRLFDMTDERQLARGGIERIGAQESKVFVEIGAHRRELVAPVPDHAVAVRQCLEQLTDPQHGCLKDAAEARPAAFFNSFTSCQEFSASMKFMYPGLPFKTSTGSARPSFMKMHAGFWLGLQPYFSSSSLMPLPRFLCFCL